MARRRAIASVLVGATIAAGCSAATDSASVSSTSVSSTAAVTTAAATTAVVSSTEAATAATTVSPPPLTAPDWLGTRTLATNETGFADPQPTPPELADRQLPTEDLLPPPPTNEFVATIGPFAGEPLARSTWRADCPVGVDELRYATVTFWGFDGAVHTGELVIHADAVEDVVAVFEELHRSRFPIESMRIVTIADLETAPTGDGNNTASFVCRAVTGGTGFSEHAFGLAIDINPFHNPYSRGGVVLPELATAYLDRSTPKPGMIAAGDEVVTAFAAIGWEWGGEWSSLKDFQHFAANNR